MRLYSITVSARLIASIYGGVRVHIDFYSDRLGWYNQVVDDGSSEASISSSSSSDEEELEDEVHYETMSVEEIEDFRCSEMSMSVVVAPEEHRRTTPTSGGMMRKLFNRLFRPSTPTSHDNRHSHTSTSASTVLSTACFARVPSTQRAQCESDAPSGCILPACLQISAGGVSIDFSERNHGRKSSSNESEQPDTPLLSQTERPDDNVLGPLPKSLPLAPPAEGIPPVSQLCSNLTLQGMQLVAASPTTEPEPGVLMQCSC